MIRAVYAIMCVDGRAYVGGTTNVSMRWAVHRYQLRHGKHARREMQDAWSALGESAFCFEILEHVPEGEEITPVEQKWMDRLKAVEIGFNRAPNAKDNTGIVFSPDVRAKMSKAQSGKTLTPEHRAKIGAKSAGRVLSAEARQKISASRKGRFVGEKGSMAKMTDDDAREAIRLSAQGLFKREIAALFGVSRSAITHIVCGHTFKHVSRQNP